MSDLTPDHAEEESAAVVDDAVPAPAPARGIEMTPMVGLGGSAGSIPALQTLMRGFPADCGLAVVVVMHLSPEHESTLPELLQHCSAMKVVAAAADQEVLPGHVYVIPPARAIRAVGSRLVLAEEPLAPRGRHVAIDLFFRTLADTHGPYAAAVVLSGADGDGAIGIKRIKERGGLTVAQDPEEAEHDSMPRSAIATGMVDWVLPVADIAPRLLQYFAQGKTLRLPPEEVPNAPDTGVPAGSDEEAALRDVLNFLRTRTGRDFSYYKRATVVRRIARRMQVNGVSDLAGYLNCLRVQPGEAAALLQDLLISVTNFFRDGECFEALDSHLNELFAGKGPGDAVRVWVAACATGEEAYSLAILLSERARLLDAPPSIQIFATDLDEEAIREAREGSYPSMIEADVSEERLQRYFVKEHRGYRVRRELREMILFAQHDLLKDAPFSRLDLVSCRNLLIYLTRNAQQRVLETFHFALLPNGLLFLGSSESVEDSSLLFSVIDKKYRIFRQRPMPRVHPPLPVGPSMLTMAAEAQRRALAGPVVASAAFEAGAVPGRVERGAVDGRNLSWGELHFKMLEAMAPPTILVDGEHNILHLSPSAGRFLQFTGGEPSRNLLRSVHPSLRVELRAALFEATQSGQRSELVAPAVEMGKDTVEVAIRVSPAADVAPDLLLVSLEALPPAHPSDATAETPSRSGPDPVARHLDREIERLRRQLRETVEQYEGSTEELKASNEELQAMNEELRSATEELETSREELQSINEELTTVNVELKGKVDELGHSNSDMHNLMDATAIATVFLDRELRINRYTPSAVTLFNLIPSDVGRPLADLATRLDYTQLGDDARRVLEKLVPIEREVGMPDGKWFLSRLLPYRTIEDHIAGVVVCFIDITERKEAEEVRLWLSAVVASSTDAIISFSIDLTILSWNAGATRVFGYDAAETIGRPLGMLDRQGDADQEVIATALREGRPAQNLERVRQRKDGSEVHVALSISPIKDGLGQVIGGTAIARDVTEQKKAAEALRNSEERLRLIVESATDYAIFSTDLARRITIWNSGAERLLGYTEAEAMGREADMIFTPEDRAAGAPDNEQRTAMAEGRAADDRFHMRKDGSVFWASGAMMVMRDATGAAVGLVKILRDQTAVRESQQALERSQGELVDALQANEKARVALQEADLAKDRFLAVLSHELRNPLASIDSAASLLLTPGVDGPDREAAAQVVRRQAQAMKSLMNDLLDVSRLTFGRLELHRQQVLLAPIVDAALETTRPLLDAAGHTLSVELPPYPVQLDADPLRLNQVLSNLLTNAIKYTPPGGRVELHVSFEGEHVLITVRDNGVGMKPEDIGRMFEMFAQADAPANRANAGLGIGLALVRSIVELHGGTVEASSPGLGQGSELRVRLPARRAAPGAAPAAEQEGTAPPVDRSTRKRGLILIADDNVDASWGISKLLEISGFATVRVAGGQEAVSECARRQPDVAILDIGMPDLNGHDAARQIRATPWGRQMVLIAATGWGQESDERKALEAGFDAHMTKPVDLRKLAALVDTLLEQRKAQPSPGGPG
ncbi:CheR family methyltransferase [Caenimonas terrae]|uniref:CheR family methyltransferase n=1 Tax=Caenimonas terrae TaxID=696074 RepID=A0ABW0NB42_9BURK